MHLRTECLFISFLGLNRAAVFIDDINRTDLSISVAAAAR